MRPRGATLPWLTAAWVCAAAGPLSAQEATRFAPTTTVNLQINAVLGALQTTGSEVDRASNSANGAPLLNGVSLNHEARLTIDTSFRAWTCSGSACAAATSPPPASSPTRPPP
jgi:hypothetical protein